MAANKQLLVLPGDGIGPEVMAQVRRVVDWFDKRRAVHFDLKEGLVGGAALDKHGTPLTDETLADALSVDAVLFVVVEVVFCMVVFGLLPMAVQYAFIRGARWWTGRD